MKRQIGLFILIICLLIPALVSCRQAEPPADHEKETETQPTTQPSEQETEPGENNGEIEPSGSGGTQICLVHDDDYHGWEDDWVDYIGGEDELIKWIEQVKQQWEEAKKAGAESDCLHEGQNVKAFIDYFQIPRELCEATCNRLWSGVHNIDLLYSDDIEAIEAYYRDIEKREETEKKQSIFSFAKNAAIINHIDFDQVMETGTEEEKRKAWADWISIFELVAEYDVSRAELERYLKEAKDGWKDPVVYDYNLDLVYNEDGSLKPYDKTKTVVELDALFCGVENLFTD